MEQWLLISQGEVIVILVFVCLSDYVGMFVYLCVHSPISQYNFVKCGTIVTKLYIETTGYAESRGKHSENILVGGGGLHWHIKKGLLITGTTRNKGGGGVKNYLVKREGLRNSCCTLLPIYLDFHWWYVIVMLVSIRWRLPSIPGIIWKQNVLLNFQCQKDTLEKEWYIQLIKSGSIWNTA